MYFFHLFCFAFLEETSQNGRHREDRQNNLGWGEEGRQRTEPHPLVQRPAPIDSLAAPLPPPPEKSVKRSFQPPPKSLEKKSILDFLGIFDTRKFFYIPTERKDEGPEEGILDIISNFISG